MPTYELQATVAVTVTPKHSFGADSQKHLLSYASG